MPDTQKLSAEEEAATTVFAEDLPVEPTPLPSTYLLVGDEVSALKTVEVDGDVPNQAAVLAFTVTGFDGYNVLGAPIFMPPIDTDDGWTITLVRRDNVFPDTLTQIRARLYSGEYVDLMGKGLVWSNVATGSAQDMSSVQSYTLADGTIPDMSQYTRPAPAEPDPVPFAHSTSTPPERVAEDS